MPFVVSGAFAGLPLINARSMMNQDRSAMDFSGWEGLANSYTCGLGEQPGVAWILMARSDVEKIDTSKAQALEFGTLDCSNSGAKKTSLLFPSMYFLHAQRVLVNGAQAQHKSAVFICQLQDRRWILSKKSITAAYNMRIYGAYGNSFQPATLNGGALWSWADLLQDLAGKAGVRTLTLPSLSPALQSVPENVIYSDCTAWHALCDCCRRIGCAVRYRPVQDDFSIIQLGKGAADPFAKGTYTFSDEGGPVPAGNFTITAGEYKSNQKATAYTSDEDFVGNSIIPETVIVQFENRFPSSGQYLQFGRSYSISVATSSLGLDSDYTIAAGSAVSGTEVIIQDAMGAIYSGTSTTPVNLADLQQRAKERTADYIKSKINCVQGRIVCSGFAKVWPGPTISKVVFHDYGDFMGCCTDIHREPIPIEPDRYKPPPHIPLMRGILAQVLPPAGACGTNPTQALVNLIGPGPNAWTLVVSGNPNAGTFKLEVGSQSITVSFNWTASQLQTAIKALSNVVAAKCMVAAGSGPLPVAPIAMQVVFTASETNPIITVDTFALTGGSSPTATITPSFGYLGADIQATNRSQSIDSAIGTTVWCFDSGSEVNVISDC